MGLEIIPYKLQRGNVPATNPKLIGGSEVSHSCLEIYFNYDVNIFHCSENIFIQTCREIIFKL